MSQKGPIALQSALLSASSPEWCQRFAFRPRPRVDSPSPRRSARWVRKPPALTSSSIFRTVSASPPTTTPTLPTQRAHRTPTQRLPQLATRFVSPDATKHLLATRVRSLVCRIRASTLYPSTISDDQKTPRWIVLVFDLSFNTCTHCGIRTSSDVFRSCAPFGVDSQVASKCWILALNSSCFAAFEKPLNFQHVRIFRPRNQWENNENIQMF